jgi:hypothetical protein
VKERCPGAAFEVSHASHNKLVEQVIKPFVVDIFHIHLNLSEPLLCLDTTSITSSDPISERTYTPAFEVGAEVFAPAHNLRKSTPQIAPKIINLGEA